MAKKNTSAEIYDVPATLQEHPFYGLRLDEYQKVFRDAITRSAPVLSPI